MARGTQSASGSPLTSGNCASPAVDTETSVFSSRPPALCSPSTRSGKAALVVGLSRISPASAPASIATVCETSGPQRSSSRLDSPTRKNRKAPVLRPTCMRSVTTPTEVRGRPIARRDRLIPYEARAARAACSSPEKNSKRASPPNLTRPPPFSYATSRRRANVALITSVSSSAPAFPCCASRSDMAVNPERSTNASVPSSSRQVAPGSSRSHSTTTRETYGARPAAETSALVGAVAVTVIGRLWSFLASTGGYQ